MSLVQARSVMVGDQCIIDTRELQRNARRAMLHICVRWQEKKYQRKAHVLLHCRRGCKKRRGLAFVKLTMGVDHLRASRTCPRRLRDGRRKLATCIVPHAHARALAQFVCTVPFKPPSSSMPLLAIETKCLNTPLHPVVSCHSPTRM
jgi:hypothetical protein